jgi:ABC-type antimicrobial peptide transport system permease subunit
MDHFWGNQTLAQRGAVFAIRSSRAGSQNFLDQLRQAVWSVNPELPLARVETLEQIYRASMARSAFTLVMLAIAAAMALLLGIIGIYGVISYAVSQRTRELGIRLALGAPQLNLKTMVVRSGVWLAAIGAGVGLAASAGLTRIMASWLYGIGRWPPSARGLDSLRPPASPASWLPGFTESARSTP